MSVGIYRAAVAMSGHERRLDTIAANLANLETPGYKRVGTAAHEFLVRRGSDEVRGLVLESQVDFSQGNLERTGGVYDLALVGDGFFAVEGPEGEMYTRGGSFRTTADGALVTEEGFQVAWKTRSAAINPTGLPVVVNGEGFVRQGTSELGQLKLAAFEDNARLRQHDGGFWIAPASLKEATSTAAVHQYSLEESNATGVEEVIAMIAVQRAFGAVSNLVTSMQRSYARLTRSA